MEAAPRVRSGLLRILLRAGRLSALVSRVWRGDLERFSHSQPPRNKQSSPESPISQVLWHSCLSAILFPSPPLPLPFSSLFRVYVCVCVCVCVFKIRVYYVALVSWYFLCRPG